MKKFNNTLLKTFSAILVALLGLFGFSNCETRVEYGSPHADYKIKGTMMDKATKQAIPGIKVLIFPKNDTIQYSYYEDFVCSGNCDTTDVKGNFEITSGDFYIGDNLYRFRYQKEMPYVAYISDIDSTENGWYNDTIVDFDFKDAVKTKEGKGWYSGEYTKTLNVELTEKQ